MGSTFWTTCQTCRKEAPELGDCGFIGSPSLSRERVSSEDELQPFGYIYEGFLAVAIDPLDLHLFHVFLEEHKGHDVRTSSDQDDEEDSEDSEPEAESDDLDDDGEAEDFGIPEGFGMFLYEVQCPCCDESFQTATEACLREAPELPLTPERIGLFQRRVRDTLDDDFYHSEPFSYEDLEALSEFFDRHADHEPIAKLLPGNSETS